jgi:hypothetical protein
VQNCPFCLHPCRLDNLNFTFCHEFVDVIDELEAKDDVISNHEVNTHAVEGSFFDCKLAHLLLIVVSEVELNVAVGPALAYKLNSHYFHFCRLVLLQSFLLDVSQQLLLILFE